VLDEQEDTFILDEIELETSLSEIGLHVSRLASPVMLDYPKRGNGDNGR